MRRSGVGCGPVHGGRTERLHLGRGPHVRRPPGDRREKKDKDHQSWDQTSSLVGPLPSCRTLPLLSEDDHVFSRFPSRVQEEFTAHTILQTALLSMFQTLKYSKPPPDAKKKTELMQHHSL